jgi:hypothetical protein
VAINRKLTIRLLLSIAAICLASCGGSSSGGCDYYTGECYEPDYDVYYDEPTYDNYDYYEEDPYGGYGDGFDQDCADVGEEVWVGDYDPDGLDADGDGWGCETWP